MTASHFPISTLPAPYDIVWCCFPEHTDLGSPGPKARPAIVLNVAVHGDGEPGEVQVVYGTTKLKMAQRWQDFFVTNVAEMDACGLNKATRFDLDRIAWVPWSQEWFDCLAGYPSPVIGRLTSHGIQLFQIVLSYRRKDEPRLDI